MQLETGFTKELPAPLTPEEVENRSTQLARLLESIADTETEAKKIARQYSEKLKGMRLQAMTLAHAVSRREESRPVLCSERADYRRFTIETYRHDTGAVVESRAMEQDELEEARQGHLFVRVADRDNEERKKSTAANDGGKGLDLEAPTIESVEEKGEALAAELKDALETIRNPDGTGRTKVSHGFAGEPMKQIGGPVDDEAEVPGTAITDPGAVLEGKAPAPPSSPAGALAAGFASAQAAQNAAAVAGDDDEEDFFDDSEGDDESDDGDDDGSE